MKPTDLREIPPWELPEDSAAIVLRFLRDPQAEEAERLAATEIASDLVVINDEIARTLLAVSRIDGESVEVRRAAAIALGPALEDADLRLLDEAPELDDESAVSTSVVVEIQESLCRMFHDAGVPKHVRRAALEASVRAPQPWHGSAVRESLGSDDRDWRLSGIFCSRFIRGFDEAILDALESDDPEIEYEAVCAAGNWGLRDAWPHVAALLSESEDKALRLAAIEAAPYIAPDEAVELLIEISDSDEADDEEIRDAVEEALAFCSSAELDDEYDDELD